MANIRQARKVNQACQSIWPEIDKGENKVKFESVSAGIPNISQMGVSAKSANTERDKKILNIGVWWQAYRQTQPIH